MSAVASQSANTIMPKDGEAYAEFLQRAHGTLARSEPDWEARNRKVWDAWDRRNGQSLSRRAGRRHNAEQDRLPMRKQPKLTPIYSIEGIDQLLTTGKRGMQSLTRKL